MSCWIPLDKLIGSTIQAARVLHLSQPTVSRRHRVLARELGLRGESNPGGYVVCVSATANAFSYYVVP